MHLVEQGICCLMMAHERRDVRIRAKRDAHTQLRAALDNLAAALVGARALLRNKARLVDLDELAVLLHGAKHRVYIKV